MRKSSSRRAAVLPFNTKNRVKTELPALVALSAIGEAWFSAEHQMDLLAVALVVGEIAEPDTVPALCARELRRLCEQSITMEQKVEIAMNLAECLPWLQMQQNVRVQRALETVLAMSADQPIAPEKTVITA